jgi:hypothetical protein
MKKMIFAAMAVAMSTSFVGGAIAEETPHAGYRETGSQRDWVGIFSPDRGVGKSTTSCAIYSRPKTSEVFSNDAKVDTMRGELAAFISWSGKASDTSGEISFMVGAPVVEGKHDTHALTVDGDARFELVGVGDRLYVMPQDDAAALQAVRRGSEMVVTAESAEGHVIKDAYSLMGVQGMTATQKVECR